MALYSFCSHSFFYNQKRAAGNNIGISPHNIEEMSELQALIYIWEVLPMCQAYF